MSWKKQTVLLGALRAPDDLHSLKVKQIVIWIRSVVLNDADPMTGFMHKALGNGLPLFEHIDREFERLPLHAAHHIILALEVIAFEHPESDIAEEAATFYYDAVNAQHLNPERRTQYEQRMADNPARVEKSLS